jgi:dTDP-4-amino-4,6-dideoxygalactose transaminase
VATSRWDFLKTALADAGITTSLNYPKALPFYPAYDYLGHKSADFPAAYRNQSRILSLPIYPEMTDEMIEYVADQVSDALAASSQMDRSSANVAGV